MTINLEQKSNFKVHLHINGHYNHDKHCDSNKHRVDKLEGDIQH